MLYRTGTSVQVTAPDAPPGFVFDHWSGDLTGSDNPITVVMGRDITLTANYVPADNNNTATAAPPPGLCGLGIVEMSLAAIAGLATLPLCTRRRPHISGR